MNGRYILTAIFGLTVGCTGEKAGENCDDLDVVDPPCVEPRTRSGSLVHQGYCFQVSNHACRENPVDASLELSVESFETWGSSANGYARSALVEGDVRSAVSDTVDWMNNEANAAFAQVVLSYSTSDEISEAEFSLEWDQSYKIGMLSPEGSTLALEPGEMAKTQCWYPTATPEDGFFDCDIALRSTYADPEFRRALIDGTLPADPLRFHTYVPWATGLPNAKDDPAGGQYSLRFVLVHEFLHVLGFAESPDVPDSFYAIPLEYGNSLPLNLSCDDRRALLFLYCPDSLGESWCTDVEVAGAMNCATSG